MGCRAALGSFIATAPCGLIGCPPTYFVRDLERCSVLLDCESASQTWIACQDSVSGQSIPLARSGRAMYAGLFEGSQQLLNIVGVRKIYSSIYQHGFQCFLCRLLSVETENLQTNQVRTQSGGSQIIIRESHPLPRIIRRMASHAYTTLRRPSTRCV